MKTHASFSLQRTTKLDQAKKIIKEENICIHLRVKGSSGNRATFSQRNCSGVYFECDTLLKAVEERKYDGIIVALGTKNCTWRQPYFFLPF
jgi:NADH dehydrogenase FAD-containing subunit